MPSTLTGPERKKLFKLMTASGHDYASLKRIFGFMHPRLDLPAVLADKSGTDDIITAVLDRVEQLERLEEFLKELQDSSDSSPTLKDFCADLLAEFEKRKPSATYDPSNAFDACFVLANQPFLDRKDFRAAMQKQPSAGFGAIVVNGPKGVGKSHCYELALYAARRSEGQLRVAWRDLKRLGSWNQPAEALISGLGREMGLSLDHFPGTSSGFAQAWNVDKEALPGRWAQELKGWFLGCVGALPNTPVWTIVLDGFGHPLIPADTKELIVQLVDGVRALPNLNLILIDYQVPDIVRTFVDEPAPLGELTDQDILGFLQSAGRQRGREISESEAAEFAAEVLQRVTVPDGDERRMREIAVRIMEVLKVKHSWLLP